MSSAMERPRTEQIIEAVREEVATHAATLSAERARDLRHGYLLACDLIEKRIDEARRHLRVVR